MIYSNIYSNKNHTTLNINEITNTFILPPRVQLIIKELDQI